MAVREAPVLVVIGADGKPEMVNYRVKGDVYIVDRLFERGALLLAAGKKQKRVEMTRGTYRAVDGGCAMATTDIGSPEGLDLSPEPPGTIRVSKRAGVVFLAVCAVRRRLGCRSMIRRA